MATYDDLTSVSETLTGTTADTVTINQLWPELTVINFDAAEGLWLRMDGITAVASADGTLYVPPGDTRRFIPNLDWLNRKITISIVGDGNAYSIEGNNATTGVSPGELEDALENAYVYFTVAEPTGNEATDSGNIQAAMSAAIAQGGGTVLLHSGEYELDDTSLVFAGDNVIVRGQGREATRLHYTGSGAAVKNSNGTSIRRRCGIERLSIDISDAQVGARAFEVENFYRGRFTDLLFDGHGLACTPLKLIGSGTQSTYFNIFDNVDCVGNTACVDIGQACNANRFIGGVWEGTGYSVYSQPSAGTVDTCVFRGVAMQTTGATIIQLGGGAGTVSYFQFTDCRLESTAAVVCGTNAQRNFFHGGSFSGGITVTRGDATNSFIIPSSSIFLSNGIAMLTDLAPYDQSPFPVCNDPRQITSNGSISANRAIYMRGRGAGSVAKVAFDVNVASGNVDVGIYTNTGSGRSARPASRRSSSGSVACPASGYAEVALGATVAMLQGEWFAIAPDTASSSFSMTGPNGSSSQQAAGLSHFQGAAFPLPASAGPSGTNAIYSFNMIGVP